MLYTIYINISQSMMYYDGVKKTFFLPHIFLKRAMAELICRRSFFCADSDENIQEEVTAMLAWAGACSCIFEERRDNARMQFWHMSCPRGQR